MRNAVIRAINNSCQCDCQEVYITNEQLHCDLSYPTLANYRAKITSFKSLSSNELVTIIEQWILSNPSVRSGPAIVTFDTSCPISITLTNDPFCSNWLNPSTQSSSAVVPAISSVIVIMILVVIIVVVVVLVLLYLKQKRSK